MPALELDDARVLGESRAICTYLEVLVPQPNLMGTTFEERAFIEMADRRMEWHLFGSITNCVPIPIRAWRRSNSRSSRSSARHRGVSGQASHLEKVPIG